MSPARCFDGTGAGTNDGGAPTLSPIMATITGTGNCRIVKSSETICVKVEKVACITRHNVGQSVQGFEVQDDGK